MIITTHAPCIQRLTYWEFIENISITTQVARRHTKRKTVTFVSKSFATESLSIQQMNFNRTAAVGG